LQQYWEELLSRDCMCEALLAMNIRRYQHRYQTKKMNYFNEIGIAIDCKAIT
jgi:hypothetical protein